MPGKSRRGKGKYSVQSKKKKDRLIHPAAVTQPPEVAQSKEPVSAPGIPAPSARVPTPVTKPTAVHYPYIAAELRTISILAGVMMVVLVVLALVLS